MAEMLEKTPLKDILESIKADQADMGVKPTEDDSRQPVTDKDGLLDVPDDTVNRRSLKRQISDPSPQDTLLGPWVEFAKTRYFNNCKLIVEPGSTTGIAESVKTSSLKAR